MSQYITACSKEAVIVCVSTFRLERLIFIT